MHTRLTELLNIEFPIIQGAMHWLARAPLCAAVSNAGGLGVINAKSFSPKELEQEIQQVRGLTERPFCVNVSMLPDTAGADSPQEWLEVCVAQKVPVVETAGRSPAAFAAALKDAGIILMHKVPAVRFALSAQKAGVDAVTVVGAECGGHPGGDLVTSLVLIPQTRRALDIPLIAGGGIATGQGLAAALALGADGVVMGTRFLMAEEVALGPGIRERLLAANEGSTRLVLGSIKNTARVLDNRLARECAELEALGAGVKELMSIISGERGKKALEQDDPEDGLLALGQCVGLVDEILPAAEIIKRTVAEAREAATSLTEALQS